MENSNTPKPDILIVDDEPENIRILATLLKEKYSPIAAINGLKALELVNKGNRPDLILLDVMMPEMDGYEVCNRLKSDKNTRNIPVIFITAKSEPEDEIRGLESGAVDYIRKPFDPEVVEARIHLHLLLKQQRDNLSKDVEQLLYSPPMSESPGNDELRSLIYTIIGNAVLMKYEFTDISELISSFEGDGQTGEKFASFFENCLKAHSTIHTAALAIESLLRQPNF
ncbi:MAG: response regulator [Desulfobacteraceae bacterium]|nr:response regulator [Desulfobacteraceae bacterium]